MTLSLYGGGVRLGRVAGRVRLLVGNRWSGRVNVSPGRVGSKKSDPWTTLGSIAAYLGPNIIFGGASAFDQRMNIMIWFLWHIPDTRVYLEL